MHSRDYAILIRFHLFQLRTLKRFQTLNLDVITHIMLLKKGKTMASLGNDEKRHTNDISNSESTRLPRAFHVFSIKLSIFFTFFQIPNSNCVQRSNNYVACSSEQARKFEPFDDDIEKKGAIGIGIKIKIKSN